MQSGLCVFFTLYNHVKGVSLIFPKIYHFGQGHIDSRYFLLESHVLKKPSVMPMEPSLEMLWDLPVPNSPAEGALENTAKPPLHPDS